MNIRIFAASMPGRIAEYLALLLLLTGATYGYLTMQPQIALNDGYGWDGLEYLKIYQYFSGTQGGSAEFPFCNRIGTPWLATLLPGTDPHTAFKWVNIGCGTGFSLLVYAIAKYAGYGIYYRFFSVLVTQIHYFSPVRFTQFYPVYTDPAFLALLALAFLFLLRQAYGKAFLILLLAYPFREVSIYIAPVFLAAAAYLGGVGRKTWYQFGLALVGMLLIKLWIASALNCHGLQAREALKWTYWRFSDPQLFLAYFAAVAMTAAPVVYLRHFSQYSNIEIVSFAGLVFSAILSFFGGSDSSRIFFSFYPMYFLAIIAVIRNRGSVFSCACALGFLVTNRFGNKILEPLHHWPANDESGFFWQYPDSARVEVALMVLAVWAILFLLYELISRFSYRSSVS